MARRSTKTKIQSFQMKEDDETHSYKLHNILSVKQIVAMKECFEKHPGRHMNKNIFRKALLEVAHVSMTDTDFENLCDKLNFSRIWTVVYWEEFLTYLRVGLDSENIHDLFGKLELPITGTPKQLQSYHRLTISKMIFYPELLEGRTTNNLNGVYLTCSRDGAINYWSVDMEKERTVYSKSPQLQTQQTWITDIICLPDVYVICTASTERELRFYDTTAKKFELRVIIQSLDEMVTAMHYTFYDDVEKESKLIIGNCVGKVKLVYINTKDRGPFKSMPKLPLQTVTYNQFIKGGIPGMTIEHIPTTHTDLVHQVAYYENIHCIVSISSCSKDSMLIYNSRDINNYYSFNVTKGFTCFAIASASHMIITGGPDLIIRLWNPFVPSRALSVFRGHHATIISIVLQDDNRILVTLDKLKCIKIWDITEQKCMQNYVELPSSLGERTALCTYYNPGTRELFVASNKIVVVKIFPRMNGEYTDGISHTKEVSVILYNSLSKTVITCGFDSNIIVWNPWRGTKIQYIRHAHTINECGEIIPVGITAAAIDPCKQLLITGASNGTLKVWNFIVRSCMRNMSIEKQCEIYSIVWIKNRILVMGQNRVVTEFADLLDVGSTQSKSWMQRHQDDILCSATYHPQVLVTASFSGEIVFWRMETGQSYGIYNVANPTERITMKFQAKEVNRSVNRGKKRSTHPTHEPNKTRKVTHERSLKVAGSITVNAMICLTARPVHPQIGTLVVALDNGIIQIWSVHPGGGYLTEFKSNHSIKDYAISLGTDEQNKYLFTGHMAGYIKTWHLINFGIPEENHVHVCMPELRLQFPFMWNDTILGRAKRAHRTNVPILLNSYKAHLKPVSGIIYADIGKIVISCSSDFSARVWTLGGRYMGTLGTFKPWTNISPLHTDEERVYPLPADIQRSASFTTNKVLTGGKVEKMLTKKQQQQQMEQMMAEDINNVYGKRVSVQCVLGKQFKPPVRESHHYDMMLDTSMPEVPIYSELVLPPHKKIERPPTPELMKNLQAQTRLTMAKIL